MSKKHKQQNSVYSQAPTSLSHEAEYRIIKFDLIKVVILNLVYFAVLVLLYLGNQRSHFLDNWFARILHF